MTCYLVWLLKVMFQSVSECEIEAGNELGFRLRIPSLILLYEAIHAVLLTLPRENTHLQLRARGGWIEESKEAASDCRHRKDFASR